MAVIVMDGKTGGAIRYNHHAQPLQKREDSIQVAQDLLNGRSRPSQTSSPSDANARLFERDLRRNDNRYGPTNRPDCLPLDDRPKVRSEGFQEARSVVRVDRGQNDGSLLDAIADFFGNLYKALFEK